MVTIVRDFTNQFNSSEDASAGSTLNLDVSAYDYVMVQIIGINGTVTFNGSLDNGSSLSNSGNAETAINWVSIQATNMNNGTAVNNTAAQGIFKFTAPTPFIQLTGSAVTITKLLVYFAKISL